MSADAPARMPAAAGVRYLGLALLVAGVWLAMLPLRPLFNPDEGRYAEIPREMLASGDWIVPHLNGLIYLEKPPLQYWATAVTLSLFGRNEFAARLYTALCALAGVLLTWLTARHGWGAAAAWRAAAILAGMVLFVVMGQLLTLDMSLTLYMTAALAAFLRALAVPRPAAARGWMMAAWAATALGVLTKGPVAAAIPAGVLALYGAYTRDLGIWRRLHVGAGLPLFLALTLPWFALTAHRVPGFVEFFFVHEHVARYLTPSADREEAWWFYAPVFLVGSAPWTLSVLRALFLGWPRPGAGRGAFDAGLFLKIWVWFVSLFFSLSDSKLMPYILPAMPPLALLIAALPDRVLARDLSRTAMGSVAAALGIVAVCLIAPHALQPSDRSACFLALGKPFLQIALVLGASGLYVLSRRRRDATESSVFLGVGWCLAGLLLMRGAAAVAPIYSGAKIARALPAPPADSPLYILKSYDQTLPFYWGRTVELVSFRGELDFGLERDPAAEIATVSEFEARWVRQSSAYAVMERPMFEELTSRGVPMRELAQDVGRVLVARR